MHNVDLPSKLLDVRSTDPDDARRRRLLNILLVGVASLVAITLTVTGFLAITGTEGRNDLLLLLLQGGGATLAGIALVYAINRHWSGTVASSLFLLLLTIVFALSDEPRQVVEGRSVFLFTIPILMASVILRPWASFALAGLSSLVISVLAFRLPEYVPPVPTMLGLFAVAFVAWLSARSLEDALRDLRAINRELDQRVEKRTQELQAANEELAQANERLRELDRLKSKFVSMVSHELRTPLGAIQGFAEMLQAGIYGSLSKKQDDALERIKKNTRRLLIIVNDLLDQARIEAGELSIRPTLFSPHELIENLEATVGVLVERKGIELTTEVADDIPDALYGDKERLHQILVNLTDNAVKFTEEGGVHVHICRPDGKYTSHWAMEISDTGPGISEEDRELVFAPFRRVDDSMTREHIGVGLGLSIVKQLVELMNGDIILESEPGHGSTFTVVLPLQREKRRAA
jgi:signal transduction histidine kinase